MGRWQIAGALFCLAHFAWAARRILVGMRVRVLFFGVLKDLLGAESETAELPAGAKAAEVVRHFAGKAGEAGSSKGLWSSLAIAVNREYATGERVLADGDEVALLPPVSGGAMGKNERENSGAGGAA